MQKVKMQTAAHQAYTYQHMVFTIRTVYASAFGVHLNLGATVPLASAPLTADDEGGLESPTAEMIVLHCFAGY